MRGDYAAWALSGPEPSRPSAFNRSSPTRDQQAHHAALRGWDLSSGRSPLKRDPPPAGEAEDGGVTSTPSPGEHPLSQDDVSAAAENVTHLTVDRELLAGHSGSVTFVCCVTRQAAITLARHAQAIEWHDLLEHLPARRLGGLSASEDFILAAVLCRARARGVARAILRQYVAVGGAAAIRWVRRAILMLPCARRQV